MAAQNRIDLFDAYFRKADLDGDGQISGAEAVAFFQGTNLPKQVLAQVWMHADQKKLGYLGRQEFYNALRLVTVAQSKRDLTPDIVKAALHGPASARIPAPQINIAATPAPHPRVPTQSTANPSVPSQTFGLNGASGLSNVGVNQQYAQSLQNQVVRPPQAIPSISSQMQSQNWQSGNSGGFTMGVSNQVHNRRVSPTSQVFGLTASGLTPSMQTRPQATPVQISSIAPKLKDTSIPSSQLPAEDSKALVVSGNGFASDSLFGDVFSTTSSQSKQTSLVPTSSAASNSTVSMTSVQASGPHPSAKSSPVVSLHGTLPQQPVGGQYPPDHPAGRQYQQIAGQSNGASGSTGFPAGPGNSASAQSAQSQPPWPKMTQSDGQKYTKVFVQVDTDRDGKITGNQARNLFLSWKLPREVLKQVWDLSDQDNDSMLSLREFCTALYLMERYREGRPLPSVLPNTIISDETPSTTGHPPALYRNVAWGPAHGFQQPQATSAQRSPLPSAKGRPPRPGHVSQTDAQTLPMQKKSKVPILEKNLVDQLSQEEQDSLNSKFKEATEANKKVEELEKEIHDSKAKTEFFRSKMQELILYKSRCDNRLNEIIERTSADKREVEALAKKYEEKYRLSGDVASRLTIEESTFRDIQEKKMELYQAIVKIEQADNKDGALQDRANHIQSNLEELVKSVNERCKQYGLRAKPTSLAELPFGWQLGIQEGAADWDEDWDKFEDEGFTFVKELTLDVQNVIAPPKPKSSLVQKETASGTAADANSDKVQDTSERIPEKDLATDQSDLLTKSSSGNPAVAPDKQSQELQDSHVTSSGAGGSPHAKKADDIDSSALAKESRSDQGRAEPLFSEDKSFDEPSWGNFDSQFPDQVWGFDNEPGKEMDPDSIFGLGGFNIKPIKTQSSHSENSFPGLGPIAFDSVPSTPAYTDDTFNGKSLSIFPESVPSTPAYTDNMFKGKGSSVFADSVPSTPAYADNMFKGQNSNVFADSVPSTPAYDNMFKGQSSSSFGDTVPSTPVYIDNMFKGKSSSAFADSVPSTPAYSDNMFNGQSLSFFADSVPSTPAYHYGSSQQSFGEGTEAYSFDSFSRSDSFNMQDGGLFQSRTFDRFNSMRSSTDFDQGNGFPPSSFDSFNAHGKPDKSLSRFDSMQSTTGFDQSHDFQSFDDNDAFGSTGPFRTSMESQTPRRDTDKWSAF